MGDFQFVQPNLFEHEETLAPHVLSMRDIRNYLASCHDHQTVHVSGSTLTNIVTNAYRYKYKSVTVHVEASDCTITYDVRHKDMSGRSYYVTKQFNLPESIHALMEEINDYYTPYSRVTKYELLRNLQKAIGEY